MILFLFTNCKIHFILKWISLTSVWNSTWSTLWSHDQHPDQIIKLAGFCALHTFKALLWTIVNMTVLCWLYAIYWLINSFSHPKCFSTRGYTLQLKKLWFYNFHYECGYAWTRLHNKLLAWPWRWSLRELLTPHLSLYPCQIAGLTAVEYCDLELQ